MTSISSSNSQEASPTSELNSTLDKEEDMLIVEFQRVLSEMTSNDRSKVSELDTLIMKSLETSDQASILREKDLRPFYNKLCKEMSKKLWLPTKTDLLESDSTLLPGSLKKLATPKSWFSTRVFGVHRKNSLQTCFPSSQFSQRDSTGFENNGLRSKQSLKKKRKKSRQEKISKMRRSEELLEARKKREKEERLSLKTMTKEEQIEYKLQKKVSREDANKTEERRVGK